MINSDVIIKEYKTKCALLCYALNLRKVLLDILSKPLFTTISFDSLFLSHNKICLALNSCLQQNSVIYSESQSIWRFSSTPINFAMSNMLGFEISNSDHLLNPTTSVLSTTTTTNTNNTTELFVFSVFPTRRFKNHLPQAVLKRNFHCILFLSNYTTSWPGNKEYRIMI